MIVPGILVCCSSMISVCMFIVSKNLLISIATVIVRTVGAHCCELMYFWCVYFRDEIGFLNCDDICIRVVNKQFELLEYVFDSVYFDLQNDEMGLCPGVVSIVMWSSLVFLGGCRGTLCGCSGCGGCCDCDVCTVVCIAYVYAERV